MWTVSIISFPAINEYHGQSGMQIMRVKTVILLSNHILNTVYVYIFYTAMTRSPEPRL
jgi:hypothetical protein